MSTGLLMLPRLTKRRYKRPVAIYDRNLRVQSRKMGNFLLRYASKVVIDDHRAIIRLATGADFVVGLAISRCLSTTPHPMNRARQFTSCSLLYDRTFAPPFYDFSDGTSALLCCSTQKFVFAIDSKLFLANFLLKEQVALVQWLWDETCKLMVVGSNTGWTFFTLIRCKKNYVCLKKTENKRKRGRDKRKSQYDYKF